MGGRVRGRGRKVVEWGGRGRGRGRKGVEGGGREEMMVVEETSLTIRR